MPYRHDRKRLGTIASETKRPVGAIKTDESDVSSSGFCQSFCTGWIISPGGLDVSSRYEFVVDRLHGACLTSYIVRQSKIRQSISIVQQLDIVPGQWPLLVYVTMTSYSNNRLPYVLK